jgi:hypothetical protein
MRGSTTIERTWPLTVMLTDIFSESIAASLLATATLRSLRIRG